MKRLLLLIPGLAVALLLCIPLLLIIIPIRFFVYLCDRVIKALESTGTPWRDIIQYDERIGWKPRAFLNNAKYYDPFDDAGTISTDEEGWPGRNSIAESDIVVFGDSFAFGFGSRFKNAYYNIYTKNRMKAVAAPGYNMVQSLLLMKAYRKKIKGKLVVWLICLGNDPVENLKAYHDKSYSTPFVRNNGDKHQWEIREDHMSAEKHPEFMTDSFNYNRFFANICIKSPYSQRVYSGMRYLLQQAGDLCTQAGAELLVFTIPNKYQLSGEGQNKLKGYLQNGELFNSNYPDQMIGEICKQLQLSFIAGKAHLGAEDYKSRDPHWNKEGNRKVAAIINKFYSEEYSPVHLKKMS